MFRSLSDGYESMQWSMKSTLIYVGDFNGDHKTDDHYETVRM
jgi:hypothetical protein